MMPLKAYRACFASLQAHPNGDSRVIQVNDKVHESGTGNKWDQATPKPVDRNGSAIIAA
jgi:hypothetical protein